MISFRKSTLTILLLTSVSLLINISDAFSQDRQIQFPMKRAWFFEAEEREITNYSTRITAQPVLFGPYIYMASTNGVLYCIDKRFGNEIWRLETNASITDNFYLGENGAIYIVAGDILYSVDAANGSVINLMELKRPPASGIIGNTSTVFFYYDNSVTAISTSSLNIIWEYSLNADEVFTSGMQINSGVLIVGSSQGNVYALNTETGSVSWKVSAEGSIRSSFLVHGDTLYFGTDDNAIVAAKYGSDTIRWQQRVAGDVRGGLATDGESVLFYSRDRYLRAYYLDSGSPNRFAPFTLESNYAGTPLVAENKLIYVSKNKIYARQITENFQTLGYFSSGENISTSLVYDADYTALYYGTEGGRLAAVLWRELTLELELPELAGSTPRSRRQLLLDRKDFQLPEKQERNEFTDDDQTSPPDQTNDNTVVVEEEINSIPEEKSKSSEEQPQNNSEEEVAQQDTTEPEQQQEGQQSDDLAVISPDSSSIQTEEIKNLNETDTDDSLQTVAQLIRSQSFVEAANLSRKTNIRNPETIWTISIGLYCQEESLIGLLNQFSDYSVYIFDHPYEDRICYFFCIESFTDRTSAEQFLEQLEIGDSLKVEVRIYRMDSFINP